MVNKQVKAALSAVRDFISGSAAEAKVPDADNKDLRTAVAAELLASISRGNEQTDRGSSEQGDATVNEMVDTEALQQLAQEQGRSRQLFMEHGYFDEAVQDLRTGDSAADRAAAARTLGLVGSQRATAHLIAAMFDDDAEVRQAAEEALTQIGDPTVKNAPMTEVPMTEIAPESQAAEASIEDVEAGLDGLDETAATEVKDDAVAEPLPSPTEVAGEAEPDSVILQVSQVETVETLIVDEAEAATEEEQLLLEEHAVRETVEQYERQLVESAALRQKAENEARWRAEREAKIRLEAEEKRVEEETLRQQAQEEAARRRSAEAEALAAEDNARQQAEAEIHRLSEEEARLRLETGNLRQAAEELARQRRQIDSARREAAEAARRAEAARVRQEAEKTHQAELERLQNEEQALRFAVEETVMHRSDLEASRRNAESEISSLTEERNRLIAAAEAEIKQLQEEREELFLAGTARRAEAERLRREADERKRAEEEKLQQQVDAQNKVTNEIAARRAEVEVSREKAEQEAEQLAAALVRMRAAEEAREQAEQERLQVEAALKEQVENQHRLLEEARQRALEEQSRLAEERRQHDEAAAQQMAALEAVRQKAESEANQRAQKERQIHSEIDHIRIADAEVRKRIEEAETLRRTSEQAYNLAAEKVQRLEAEAHAATLQEEQMLARLEASRRDLANEAQARAAQEKRVKDEIEQFRRLQDEERPRLEAAILERTAAAARLQQMRERRAELSARIEEQPQAAVALALGSAARAAHQPDAEVSRPTGQDESSRIVLEDVETVDQELPARDEDLFKGVQPAIGSYLHSIDPYKRAAAVGELARSQGKEAFPMIANCFDDHSVHVRNAAARALGQLEPAHTVDSFNRAIEEGTEARRRSIGAAIASSGLASEAINNLVSESREATYNALSILFVMAKTGETEPLVRAIEEHENDEVRRAVVKLLTLSGQAEIAAAAMKRRADAVTQ